MQSHPAEQPLILYSTSTWLAWAIAERYYQGLHWAWCCPFLDGRQAPASVNIPPSASPLHIYKTLADETRRGERHSAFIAKNKAGILRGARAKRVTGRITESQEMDIVDMVNHAETQDFRPLLFVIPFDRVADHVVEVPVVDRAHPLSLEYIIEELPRSAFDVVEWGGG